MGIIKNGQSLKAYKGDHAPINVYKGESKLVGYVEQTKSGESVEFSTSYNDTADVTLEGNTVQSSDWYGKDGACSQYTDTKVMGKNLFNAELVSLTTGATRETGGFKIANVYCCTMSVDWKKILQPSTTYTTQRNLDTYIANATGRIAMAKSSDGTNVVLVDYGSGLKSKTIITPSDLTGYDVIWVYGDSSTTVNMSNIQIELGSTSTAYEPYKDNVKTGLVMELSGRNFFNTPQTTTLQDRSGNGNVGTPSGFAYNSTSGSDGNGGIVFDGVDDSITTTSCIPLGRALSVEVVGKVNNTSIYNNFISANPPVFIRVTNTGKVRYCIYYKQDSDGTLIWLFKTGTITLSANTTYNISLIFDGLNLKGYVNGVLDINENCVGQIVGTNPIKIGYTSVTGENSPLQGTVYSMRMYNRALSSSEVYQNYFAGTNLNVPSPTDASPVVSNLPSGTYKYTSTDGIYEFTIPEDLRGISGYTDKVVFDRVSHKGYLDGRIGKKVFDGSENGWTTSSYFTDNLFGAYILINDRKVNSDVMCNAFKVEQTGSPSNNTELIWRGASVGMAILKSRLSSVDVTGLKSWLTTRYNNGTPVILYYQLATPTRTPITFTKVSSSTKPEVPMTFITNTPSLNYPADVYSVEGKNAISRCKNLWNNTDDIINQYPSVLSYVLGTNSITLTTTASAWYQIKKPFTLKPLTNYVLSYDSLVLSGNPHEAVSILDAGNNYTPTFIPLSGSQYTNGHHAYNFKTDANGYITVRVYSAEGIGVIQYTNIQLIEGSTEVSFDRYRGYNTNTIPTLRKIGSVSDSYKPKTGEHTKRISDWVTLDGNLPWTTNRNFGGMNGVREFVFSGYNHIDNILGIKYTSEQLQPYWGVDNGIKGNGSASMYVTAPMTDTGFSNNTTISQSEAKAYFYGWKMCNADGTSPYYKSEVPYTPSTWAEWYNLGSAITKDLSGAEFTSTGTGSVGIWSPSNIKPSTKYGFLYNVVSQSLTTTKFYITSSGSIFAGTVGETSVGNHKAVLTSLTGGNNSCYAFLWEGVAGEKIKIKDYRVFELPSGSQIESDFSTMTADQLCAKYTFNGLCTKNWVHVTDGLGQTATLPTASYTGYTPYKMLYQLATPVVTNLTPTQLSTFYPYTKIETDSTVAKPNIIATAKVEG